MTIEILEVLPGCDWDTWRGYSCWLYLRFPTRIGESHYLPAWACCQMTKMARAAFVERHGCEPLFIQNIKRSAWWRAGPVEGGTDEAL